MSNSKCVCGATHILADNLLPNCTLRDAISRRLGNGNNSAGNRAPGVCNHRYELFHCKINHFTEFYLSVLGKEFAPPATAEEIQALSRTVEATKLQDGAKEEEGPILQQEDLGKGKISKDPEVPDTTHDSRDKKETEVQHKQVMVEIGMSLGNSKY